MPEQIQNMMYLFSQEVRKILGNNLCKIIVYGSYARGDFDENSDVDVMVMTSLAESDIKPIEYMLYDVAFDFLMEYGVDISVIVKNEEHFKYWLGALPFYDNVEKEGVVING
ncbi:MAG: nucleotidyltransferase domain-containing protein [Eubacterium sp.]|nr:nucleotidyltransferase domain-containing protein [Eubacterium sp.]